MRKRDVWRIDQFHLMKKIGSGYASTVYLATCRTTGNQVAVKLYHKSKLSELNHFQISREVRIHGVLDHKHIVQLWAAFEDQYGIYLITEYASKGDVFTEVERRGGQMTEAEAVRQVIYPFLTALDYLHSRHIIHRDIKPENLLFTATGVLKVGDFGLSINTSEERPVTRVGTLDYMAPEVVVCPDKHKPSDHKEMTHLVYTHLIDAWAVGVLAYELIVGKPPFDKGQKRATVQEILHGQPALPAWLSEGAAHFMVWALCKEQSRRPSVPQLMQHPWLLAHMQGPPHLHAQLGRALGRTARSSAGESINGGAENSPTKKRLGVRLLHRTTRSVSTTEAGARLAERLRPALAEVQASLEVVNHFRDHPAGTLRLNVPANVARTVLPPIVTPFLKRYPEIRLEVMVEDSFVDLLAAGCDAGIRYDERLAQDMIAVPIGPRTQRLVTAAAPAYLEAHGRPEHPGDLLHHACMRGQFSGGAMALWEFERDGEIVRIDPPGPLKIRPALAAQCHSPQPHSTPRSFDPTPPLQETSHACGSGAGTKASSVILPSRLSQPLSCLGPAAARHAPPLTLVVPPMSRRTTDACAPDHSPVLGTGSGSTSPTGSGGSSCAAGCLEHRTDALLGGVLEGALPPSKPSPARPGGLAELAGWVDSDGGATGLGSAKARGGLFGALKHVFS
ncbi:MAG: hypothetical protein WDW36_006632 [Sanguina aurantia]